MVGILGDLFGLGGSTQAPTPGLLDAAGYMDPAQYDRMRQSQSMMGLWAGLLAGGGPSLTPRNFGSALGAGLTGAQQFGSQFDEASQHRAAAQKNLADIVAKKQGFQIAQDWINKGGAPSGTPADGAPGSGSSTPNFGAGLTGAPGRLASADIYKLATDVGFKGDAAETMTAIIQGESGNRPGAIGDQGIGGSYGLTQINRKAHGDVALEALDNPRRALELAYEISKQGTDFSPWTVYKTGAYKQYLGRPQASAGDEAVPDFAGGRSLTLPGTLAAGADALRGTPPVPSVLTTPAAPVPSVLTANAAPAPGAGAALTQQQQNAAALAQTGRPIFPPGTKFNSRGEAISPDLTATLPGQRSGANIPPAVVQGFARANAGVGAPGLAPMTPAAPPAAGYNPLASPGFGGVLRQWPSSDGAVPPGAPVNVRPLAGEAVPAEAGPSFGYGSAGGAISPAVLAAAAGGAPPVPAAALPPVQPAPAPAPQGALPPAAAAAAPAPAGTRPPAGPGEVTVTLPKPPALGEMLPVPAAQPQALPAAPEVPGIPARPQIPGATPGAAVAPAVAARARQAQGVVLGLSMMGVHVPDFLQKEAGIEVAGRTAAAEAEAKQPIELQNKAFEASLTAAQKRWDALTDQQKETLAFQRGLTKDQMNAMYANVHEQYKTVLDLVSAPVKAGGIAAAQQPYEMQKIFGKEWAQLLREWDVPQQIKQIGADGVERTITTTPRQMAGGLAPGAALSGTVAGGGPGAAAVAGPAPVPGGIVTGLGPGRSAELEARGKGLGVDYAKINTDATAARSQIADLKTMQSNAQNLAAQGIFADNVQFANRVINGVTGQQADRVAAYELVTKNSEKLIRDATRQSDSQPAAIQLVMTRNSMPTPSTSVAGFDGVVGQMLGAQQYTVYKQQAAEQWLADPRHNNSLQGFENTLPVSPYAFMVNQMPDAQKAALAERLRSAGPAGAAEAQALAAQIRAAKAAGF